jgi:DNA-binding PadR family transcriptional regulator
VNAVVPKCLVAQVAEDERQRGTSVRAQHARGGRQGLSPPPVQLAVLALLIERPTYVYELSQRFDDRFGELLPVATGTVYKAVDGLLKRGLVERMAIEGEEDRRQPKPHYRATADGARTLRQSLADDMRGDPFQADMLQRLMSVSVQDARAMLDLVDRYERVCLEQLGTLAPAPPPLVLGEPQTSFATLRGELVAEERRLALEAQMKWVAYARRRIEAVSGGPEAVP